MARAGPIRKKDTWLLELGSRRPCRGGWGFGGSAGDPAVVAGGVHPAVGSAQVAAPGRVGVVVVVSEA